MAIGLRVLFTLGCLQRVALDSRIGNGASSPWAFWGSSGFFLHRIDYFSGSSSMFQWGPRVAIILRGVSGGRSQKCPQ